MIRIGNRRGSSEEYTLERSVCCVNDWLAECRASASIAANIKNDMETVRQLFIGTSAECVIRSTSARYAEHSHCGS
jgi:hypothetical protein